MISVDVKINRDAFEELEDKVLQLLEKTALEAETTMKDSITEGSKSGVIYRRNNKEHRSSAPGQAPANDTGKLASGINYNKVSDREHEIKITTEYALALEVGTSRMAPRPFIMPAIQIAKRKLLKALRIISRR